MYRPLYLLELFFYAIFLGILNGYALTSPSPIDNPELFNCTTFFAGVGYQHSQLTRLVKENTVWNDFLRWTLLIMCGLRFLRRLAGTRATQCSQSLQKGRAFRSRLINLMKSLRFGPILDFAVYALAFYSAIHNFSNVTKDGTDYFRVDVRTCGQWQISAFCVTLAWINLLFYMRALPGVGKYILLFQDVIQRFVKVFFVVFVFVMGFATSFHMLLSHREGFEYWGDSILKTIIMMSGEMEYGEIFFKEIPPEGFEDDWDLGHEHVPFPFFTYALFVAFFFLVSIVALNVLVGLAIEDIRVSLNKANIRMLKMRYGYIWKMEQSFGFKLTKDFGRQEAKEEKEQKQKKQKEEALETDNVDKPNQDIMEEIREINKRLKEITTLPCTCKCRCCISSEDTIDARALPPSPPLRVIEEVVQYRDPNMMDAEQDSEQSSRRESNSSSTSSSSSSVYSAHSVTINLSLVISLTSFKPRKSSQQGLRKLQV